MREKTVGVGETAVDQCRLCILDERLLEKVQCLAQAFFRALSQVLAALQIQIVRG
jgi:DNA-binding IclR family transcriptional regulator